MLLARELYGRSREQVVSDDGVRHPAFRVSLGHPPLM